MQNLNYLFFIEVVNNDVLKCSDTRIYIITKGSLYILLLTAGFKAAMVVTELLPNEVTFLTKRMIKK